MTKPPVRITFETEAAFDEFVADVKTQERERLIARAIAQHQRLHGYSGSIYHCTSAYCEGARDALDIGPEDIE